MIYKFIDNNGAEITVNSLSSLQSLIDSGTIKEETKIKAGLRGKWKKASEHEELVGTFSKNKEIEEENNKPQEDNIHSFLKEEIKSETTKRSNISETTDKIDTASSESEIKSKNKKNNFEIDEKINKADEEEKEEITKSSQDENQEISDEEYEKNRDKTYDDSNVIGLNIFQAVGTCFQKCFNYSDRASRSEYWWFQLVYLPIWIWSYFEPDNYYVLWIQIILLIVFTIPAISAGVRRLHDVDKSGWMIFISFIPFIGPIWLMFILADKGTEGNNRFGPYPLNLKSKK